MYHPSVPQPQTIILHLVYPPPATSPALPGRGRGGLTKGSLLQTCILCMVLTAQILLTKGDHHDLIWKSWIEKLSHVTNRAVQAQKMASGRKFWI